MPAFQRQAGEISQQPAGGSTKQMLDRKKPFVGWLWETGCFVMEGGYQRLTAEMVQVFNEWLEGCRSKAKASLLLATNHQGHHHQKRQNKEEEKGNG